MSERPSFKGDGLHCRHDKGSIHDDHEGDWHALERDSRINYAALGRMEGITRFSCALPM